MKTFCQKCGKKTKKYQMACAGCGDKLSVPNIPNYIILSIVVMIFFFIPTGIVAVVYSTKVKGDIERGETEKAISHSKKAFAWSMASIILGLVVGFWSIF